jgi:hypothetical protein
MTCVFEEDWKTYQVPACSLSKFPPLQGPLGQLTHQNNSLISKHLPSPNTFRFLPYLPRVPPQNPNFNPNATFPSFLENSPIFP